MNNFKVGDKVWYDGKLQTVIQVPDELRLLDKDYVVLDLRYDNAIYYKYIELYKSAHEKLLELGYEYISHSQGHRYKHKEEQDVIDIDLVRGSFYHFRYVSAKEVEPHGTNLELSKILKQYLEELENKK